MRLFFETNNINKAKEIQKMLDSTIEILTLNDINLTEDIPETGSTLQANALIKARYVNNKTGYNCFADDTGLIVNALNGAPGVFSARYAGPNATDDNNMQKLLINLEDKQDRTAKFVTSICLFWNDEMFVFEGELKGKIIKEKIGTNGFGYDPVFLPDGYDITLAQMDLTTKNKISHRGKAFSKMIGFLKEKIN
ncbi:MAG: RdgB/HAM1 family non-canonical purine NTP pyrophosphatase [Bacteroidia bacterium]|nr:RdgB/HAM1 family non-canonical purine NTP pyrophosphatase [Bacteroidia bacterium]